MEENVSRNDILNELNEFRDRMYRALETCLEIQLKALLGWDFNANNLDKLSFPFRNQVVSTLMNGKLNGEKSEEEKIIISVNINYLKI